MGFLIESSELVTGPTHPRTWPAREPYRYERTERSATFTPG